jgi:hypothetical protein
MQRRLATVLLACAAVGSLALAGVRIAGANDRRLADFEKHARVYGTTPALAAATLASLRMPPGYRRRTCSGYKEPEWGCWSKSPSVALDPHTMHDLILAMGARPYFIHQATYGDGVPVVQCSRLRTYPNRHIVLQLCQAEALMGHERLTILAKSFLSQSGKPTRRVIREPTWSYPTEVQIAVAGHFEHEGTRPGEEDE